MPIRKILVCVLTLGLFIIPTAVQPTPALAADQSGRFIRTTITFGGQSEDNLTAFVARFYRECLDREPDPAGLSAWVEQLKAGTKAGSDVAQGFINSPEFINRSLDDRDYMYVLYNAFFNRDPDDAGLTGWLKALASGSTREDALNGFINSGEFAELCRNYGIKPLPTSPEPHISDDIPVLLSPADGSVQDMPTTLSWGPVDGATGYEVLAECVSTTGALAEVEAMDAGARISTFLSYNLKDPFLSEGPASGTVQSVSWQVRALDSSGNWTEFTDYWTFTAE